MSGLRTGELARQAGVNVETLRFYERKGLLPPPPRRESGYREYPPETVPLIRFIKRAQELGFSLREVRELLRLRQAPRASRRAVLRIADAKLQQIDDKIRDLGAMRNALKQLVEECSGRGSLSCCPIIECLSQASGSAKNRGAGHAHRQQRKAPRRSAFH